MKVIGFMLSTVIKANIPLFTQLPGKRSVGAGGWQLQAKLTIMLWLGLYEDRDKFMETLPAGCTPRTSNIPRHITFKSRFSLL